jgi:hypothetical protein
MARGRESKRGPRCVDAVVRRFHIGGSTAADCSFSIFLGQLELLLRLVPYYDLGIFSSATSKTVRKAVNSIYYSLKKHSTIAASLCKEAL